VSDGTAEETSARPGGVAGQRAHVPPDGDTGRGRPQAIRRELLELQQRLDAGLISADAYDSAEAGLLARLNAIINERSL